MIGASGDPAIPAGIFNRCTDWLGGRGSAREAISKRNRAEGRRESQSQLRADRRRAMLLLRKLPKRYRTLLLLRITQGLSAEESGQALGIPTERVRAMQYHALTLMRDLVNDQKSPERTDDT